MWGLNTGFPVVRTDGRAGGRAVYGHVITTFSGTGSFTYPWWSAGALCAPELRYEHYGNIYKRLALVNVWLKIIYIFILYLFIYLSIYLIFTVFRCLKTRIRNSYRFTKHFYLILSQNTRNGLSGGACRLTQPLAARFFSLDGTTSF